ncbi:MAG: aminoacyl-histidine dipeptidase [Ruminococcaceae bacterium]|nr:aminoacyl-histidine dipeptidase [Oscillospiraceae bacterium]
MNYVLKDRYPEEVFRYFEEISAIPRGSGNEKGIADYLCAFASEKGLRFVRDALHNVAIFKAASAGRENEPAVMLQGHTDMVCEKNGDTVHDFEKDGIKLILGEDGWLRADGTTLGGDDGFAVATMLAILSDDSLSHPALECLFTVQEETGLGGASEFDYSVLSARKIINLDTEDEGTAVASCAGSMNLTFTLQADTVPFAGNILKLSLLGLSGGHSGTDIDKGRANSIRLMGRVLNMLYRKQPFNLISLSGGNKRNAIPRECEAIISVQDAEGAIVYARELVGQIRAEMSSSDAGLHLKTGKAPKPETMFTYKDTSRVLSFLALIPNGVIAMSNSKEGLVETSSNLGVVRTEGNKIDFSVYARSSVEPSMDYTLCMMERVEKVTGLQMTFEDRAPGWAFNPKSELQKQFVQCYEALYGKEGKVEAIHAGLECGIILEKMGGDAIAIGPDMRDIHTPDERLNLDSVRRLYRLVVKMLAE